MISLLQFLPIVFLVILAVVISITIFKSIANKKDSKDNPENW